MFGIAWNEYIIIAIVALIVIGPKELPTVLRAIGQWTAKVRRMAAEFQGQFQEALREAEMADLKKEVDDLGAQAKGFASQFDDPMNFQEATKWEPKPEIKPAPALETDASGDAAKEAIASSVTVPAPEAGAEPSAPAAPAAGPRVSEHSAPGTAANSGAAPPSEEGAPKTDEKARDGGVLA